MSKPLRDIVLEQQQTPVWIGGIKDQVYIPVINKPDDVFTVGFPPGYLDAFGRQRVSNPQTIFDSKQIFDNLPLFWDDVQVSGGGTATVYDQNQAVTNISVSANTAGRRVRQTFRLFNYEPGKGQLILLTFADFDTASGVTKEVGYIDNNNGLSILSSEGVIYFRRRTFVTGATVDNDVPQTAWNLDKLDGNGPSGVTLDPSKVQVAFISFEWLGTGDVAFGFFIDQQPIVCHIMNHANRLATVYMSTPNLPLRYSIENDGSGAADSFGHLCSSVISEGGTNATGKTINLSLGSTSVNANTVGTIYALMGIRLRTGYNATVKFERVSLQTTANGQFEWLLIWKPTVGGAGLTWSDVANYSIQQGLPDTAGNPSTTTVTGGIILDGGFVTSSTIANLNVNELLSIGRSIAGVADTLVLCARALTTNTAARGSVTIRALS